MLQKVSLSDCRQLVVSPAVDVRINPNYLGYRCREDSWGRARWRRSGRYNVCYLVDEGWIRMWLGGTQYFVGPGQGILVSGSSEPQIHFSPVLVYHEVWFALTGADGPIVLASRLLPVNHFRESMQCFDHIAADVRSNSLADDAPTVKGRHWLALLLAMFEHVVDDGAPVFDPSIQLTTSQRIRLIRWVRRHIHEHPSPAEMAHAVSLSPDYFSRKFRRTFGMSSRKWLARERIHEACQHLRETDLAVFEIAELLGYESAAHFTRQFRRTIGVTPTVFRKEVNLAEPDHKQLDDPSTWPDAF